VYSGPEGKPGRRKAAPKFLTVPTKYFDPATSGLKTTINKGINTYDIVISK
jgi:hypothetical protein